MNNKQRLELIETFTSEDLVMTNKKRVSEIYKVAHPKSSCKHEDWDLESVKTYKEFKKTGLI